MRPELGEYIKIKKKSHDKSQITVPLDDSWRHYKHTLPNTQGNKTSGDNGWFSRMHTWQMREGTFNSNERGFAGCSEENRKWWDKKPTKAQNLTTVWHLVLIIHLYSMSFEPDDTSNGLLSKSSAFIVSKEMLKRLKSDCKSIKARRIPYRVAEVKVYSTCQ